jgi:tRNA(fMet)-specific endonuclease VapC
MKRILLDTNIYSLAMKGDSKVIDVLRNAELLGISSISLGELLSGFKGGKNERSNFDDLMEFLDSPRVELYPVDENTAGFYATILNELRSKGKPIPTNDIWISAIAFQHGLGLFTRDNHFKNVPGLMLY